MIPELKGNKSIEADEQMSLKILVDKQISDITPKSFITRHKKFSISMKYTNKEEDSDDEEPLNSFMICLDALDDDSRDV